MSKLDSRNILIEANGNIYNFLNCKIEPNDGSFYVTLLRNGKNSDTVTFDSESHSPVAIKHDKPRKKLVRISYHSSGCTLYHHTEISSNYFEPISRLTKVNAFAAWSIPSLDKLDQVDSVRDEDFVINVNNEEDRIEFTLVLAPWQQEVEEGHFAIRYEGILSLIVIPTKGSINIPDGLDEYFMTLAPNKGTYDSQAMESDLALIEYHQMLQQTKDLILYSPNKAGIYTAITAVPMRVAPKVTVEFFQSGYEAELVSSKNNVVKFKVINEHGHVVKKEVPIKGMSLCSRL
jgi:hypothetical protein